MAYGENRYFTVLRARVLKRHGYVHESTGVLNNAAYCPSARSVTTVARRDLKVEIPNLVQRRNSNGLRIELKSTQLVGQEIHLVSKVGSKAAY